LDVVKRYFEERGIDEIGLEKKDIEILKTIEEAPNGVIGAETLSARIGLDPKKYLSEYEPYLIKIKFINVSGRGRSLTEKAVNYLKGKKE
jgi:Holliday junction DNA helicase RuvB